MQNQMSRRQFLFGSAVAAAGVSAVGLFGCSGATAAEDSKETELADEDRVPIRLGGLKGPTSMGLVKMLDDAENGKTKNDYQFTMAPTADELVPAILQGELDILAIPSNLGAVIYSNSEKGMRMLNACMLGAIYVLEKDTEEINSVEDLAGKTIYTVGKGSTPEYLLNFLLDKHGLVMDQDVTVEWRDDPTEIVGLLAAGTASVCMLPQPFVTVAQGQVENLRIALDTNAEWDAVGEGSKLVTAGFIARKDFVEEHPQQTAEFLEEAAASTDWVNANVSDAAVLIEKLDIVPAAIAEASLPKCNIVCITGKEMKESAQKFFQVLYDQNPESVGGEMPGDDFYYEA
ncbi:MAG: ABC transporter substrate-binding protein [Coriobacteriaceae bacterium]|nr:ABC transporter substrate-binding protein [Coriobacteriaceae bacterium]MDD6636689.1 ABC transporter substrate-binding protein [Coriobacteriaceae bacterium]MDD7431535.1 ABC transporter substrate-binding protein [Coriobacteriaceae bacterium]